MSDHDGVSRGESVRDWRHRPMSHAPPQTMIVMDHNCTSLLAVVMKWRNSYDGSDQKQL